MVEKKRTKAAQLLLFWVASGVFAQSCCLCFLCVCSVDTATFLTALEGSICCCFRPTPPLPPVKPLSPEVMMTHILVWNVSSYFTHRLLSAHTMTQGSLLQRLVFVSAESTWRQRTVAVCCCCTGRAGSLCCRAPPTSRTRHLERAVNLNSIRECD